MRVQNKGELSIFDLLVSQNIEKRRAEQQKVSERDTVEINYEVTVEFPTYRRAHGTSRNRRLDETIDFHGYVERAREANKQAIQNAGTEITSNNAAAFYDYGEMFCDLLKEKYTKLVNEAKMHDDPEYYIYLRYFTPSCPWYAGDLTDEERSIGYRNEISMLRKGKLHNLQFGDSFFRGMPAFGIAADDADILFNRQMINAQINNIFKANGIEVGKNSQYTFSVDPYTYYISVEGVDELTRQKMETALNVGENGKNLYFHMCHCSTRDGADSSQYSVNGQKKYWTYHDVLKYTGMELDKLEERDGTYYTQDGIDICDLVKKGIDQSDEVKADSKYAIKKLAVDGIHWLASIGWENIKDLTLQIDFINGGLSDKYQNIQYTAETYDIERLRKAYPYVTI